MSKLYFSASIKPVNVYTNPCVLTMRPGWHYLDTICPSSDFFSESLCPVHLIDLFVNLTAPVQITDSMSWSQYLAEWEDYHWIKTYVLAYFSHRTMYMTQKAWYIYSCVSHMDYFDTFMVLLHPFFKLAKLQSHIHCNYMDQTWAAHLCFTLESNQVK